jgi:hypothetical protein
MSKRERRWKAVERRWIARFGEPPTLKTDPALIQRILDSESPRAAVTRSGAAGRDAEPKRGG